MPTVYPPRLKITRRALAFALGVLAHSAFAQTTPVYEEQYKLMRAPNAVVKVGADLFGDTINLYNGKLDFTQTDVSLPGNNALPVAVGRRISTGDHAKEGRAFGLWELDIPHIYGTVPSSTGWLSSANNNARCSSFGVPGTVTGAGPSSWDKAEYWQGAFLYVPGQGSQEMLTRSAENTAAPGPVSQYPIVTTKFWNIECLGTISGDPGTTGQGFLATSPDGTKYYFDHVARYPARTLSKPNDTAGLAAATPATGSATTAEGGSGTTPTGGVISPDATPTTVTLQRVEIWFLPSKVVDRYGNTVTYTYDPNKPPNLTGMSSSDGRAILLTYVTDARGKDQVATVSDGTRTWTYGYHITSAEGTNVSNLDRVTLPDNSTWEFANFDALITGIKTGNDGGCTSSPLLQSAAVTGSLVHPTGATGTFTLTPTIHGRSRIANTCDGFKLATPRFFATMSVTAKSISGPGLTAMNWSYGYGTPNESWDSCTTCADYKTVTVTDPESKVTRLNYGNAFAINEGRLLQTDTIDGGTVLRSETQRYRTATQGRYIDYVGATTMDENGDEVLNTRLQPVDQRVTTQQGVTMTWLASDFGAFARPTVVTRSSTLGFSRTETTVYSDNFPKWVLGQVKTVTEFSTGKAMVSNVYDPTTATLTSVSHFGHLDQSMTYYADGTLATRKDGKNQTTTFSSYKRGIPQSVSYPNATSESAVVNNIGKVTSLTNAAGFATTFGYDSMGRLSSVTHPGADTVAWNSTTINFYKSSTPALDLPAGYWRQQIQTGQGFTVHYYDALWRPVYTERWDNADAAGTLTIVRRRYDFSGRTTFESYPKRSYGQLGFGTYNTYDALGRPTLTRTESELGNLDVWTSYPTSPPNSPDFSKLVTDARQNSTVFHYQVFDEPSENAISAINAPEGVTITIARDIFGKTKSITRSGGDKSATRSYEYDLNERLCKTVEPETGATVQNYDAANNIDWRATGLDPAVTTGCGTASVAADRKTSFGYDTLNRLTSTTYGDASPGITRTYTADSLPLTIVSNGATWTNTYNKRRLKERESLVYGGVTYNIDTRYDANGALSQLTYPDGTAIGYNPNALGEARQVGGYASAIKYHPNGAIASFTYGNGITHTLSQNARGLPLQSADGGIVSDVYSFDANGNVAGIADQLSGNVTNRTMVYDNLDRLKTVSAPNLWGTASYSYDALDNLTATTISAGGTARSTTHNFDAKNRLSSITGTAGYAFSYTYDLQGNIVARGGQGYSFDLGNRMKSATGKATYAYDGLGHRVSMVGTDSVNRIHVYSQDGEMLYLVPGTATATKYVYLHNHVLAEVIGASVVYAHTDGLGSPVAQTSSTGSVLNRTRYEPYGYIAAGSPRKIGFTGHVNDSETGLIYMQQRYYDPIAGRLLSVDPVMADEENGTSFNRYSYVNNNPLTYVDPNGREAEPIVVEIKGKREPRRPPAPSVQPEPKVYLVLRIPAPKPINDPPLQGVHPECVLPGIRLLCEGATIGAGAGLGIKGVGGVRKKPGSLGQPKGTDALRRENEQARAVDKELGLPPGTTHREISGEGFSGYSEILRYMKDLGHGKK
jgi:RHS repeat-associated protein